MYIWNVRNNCILHIEIIHHYRFESRGWSQSTNSDVQSTSYRLVWYYLEEGKLERPYDDDNAH